MSAKTAKAARWRQLLVLTILVALMFCFGRFAGWLTERLKIARVQRDFVQKVEGLGGIVYYDFQLADGEVEDLLDPDSPDAKRAWLSSLCGVDLLHDVFYVYLADLRKGGEAGVVARRNTKVTDELFEHSSELPALKWLALSGTSVTDAGIASICKNPEIERLWLSQTQITDKSLGLIAQCQTMTHLAIEGTPTSDTGLAAISALPKLRFLSIGSPFITAAGLNRLVTLTSLVELHADQLPVSDQNLSLLTRLSNLEVLSLRKTKITSLGASLLPAIQGLRELHLDGLPLNDAAFAKGFALPNLQILTIQQTDITDSGLESLAKCRSLASLRAAETPCTLKGLCHLFTDLLGRGIDEALTSVAKTQLNEDGKVVSLDTAGVQFTDADVEILAQLPELEFLTAPDSQLTDRGATRLLDLGLPKLKVINLNYTSLTDKGLLTLAKIPTLTNVHVAETLVSEQAIADLRVTQPRLTVYNSDLKAKQRIVRTLEGGPSK